ncbi:MAG: SurA N-terminal domain-containing protein [Pseudomonadota bacterium]
MLEYIRNRAQGVVAWIIVGLIIVVFALFGINHYFTGGGDNSVAKVNGSPITERQLQQAYFQQRQRLTEMFGGELPPMFTEKMIRQQVLSQLVAQEVMVQEAVESGMHVSDAQLAQIIRSAEAFHEDGKFSQEKYQQMLSAQGMNPGMFETRVRRDILAAQLESGVRDTAFVTRAEEDRMLRLQNQRRELAYLQVAIAPFEANAEVDPAEVEAFYQDNSQRFMQPERVKVDYLELNAENLQEAVEVDEQTLRSRYQAQQINYTSPEERRASHILIQAAEDAPEAELAAARDKAEQLLAQIRDGADFAALAEAESDDPGSASQGGDLGFFGRGAMVPAFEEAAYALEQDEVSDVVQSPFGFHIIRLTGVRGGDAQPFEAVRDEIRKDIQRERAEERFYDLADQLANLTYEHPDSLQLASDELELPIQSSDYFTRQGGEGIAAHPEVTGAAFGEEVLVRGNNSEVIELGRNRMVVLRVSDHQPEQVQPLEEVRDEIVTALQREKAREQASALVTELNEQIAAGEEPAQLAERDGVSWHPAQWVERDGDEVAPAILDTAFRLPPPAADGFVSESVALRSGDQAVVMLYRIEEGDPEAASEQEREQVRDQLLKGYGDLAGDALMSGARSRMDVTVKQ